MVLACIQVLSFQHDHPNEVYYSKLLFKFNIFSSFVITAFLIRSFDVHHTTNFVCSSIPARLFLLEAVVVIAVLFSWGVLEEQQPPGAVDHSLVVGLIFFCSWVWDFVFGYQLRCVAVTTAANTITRFNLICFSWNEVRPILFYPQTTNRSIVLPISASLLTMWNVTRITLKKWGLKYPEETCPSATCLPQIPHDLIRVWTWAVVVGTRRLTVWAVTWSTFTR
jgi:hypothetical protein